MTPRRLPIEGEPSECEQEVVDSVVTAGRMKGMAQSANPPETDADIDRTPTLGRELAMRDCGVDKGDGMERKDLQLPKAELYCEERRQRSGNANENVPSAYGVLLEGEWAVCASGESGCESGTSGSESIDEAAGEAGRGIGPADTPSESKTLITVSIELKSPDGGEIPRVCLGGTSCHVGDVNRLGC